MGIRTKIITTHIARRNIIYQIQIHTQNNECQYMRYIIAEARCHNIDNKSTTSRYNEVPHDI